jgi:sulfotransferase
MKRFYFLSGLPRSGSTLLSALFNQNSEIHASTNSPLLDTIHYTEEYLLYQSEQYKAHPKPAAAHKVLSSIAPNYYFDTPQNIIIDKSRGWVNQIQHITDYITPNPKIICPVRNIQDIMVSFLCLIHKNTKTSFIDEGLIRNGIEITNDNRCDYLMSSQGIIGMSYNALYESFKKGHQDKILLVEYDDLVRNPQKELNKIYDFLEEKRFSHSFENVKPKFDENDEVYQLDSMHSVRDNVEKIHRDNEKYLSKYIINKYKHMEFWRQRQTPQYSIFGLQ